MATWTIDPAHSEIGFKVKHLMITNVKGHFKDFSMEINTEGEEFENPQINFKAKTASIDTGSEDRDKHLRSADFFDSEKFPEINFVGTSYKQIDGDTFELKGDLTIKGITKPITLEVDYAGMVKDPWGNTKAGFTVNGKINRKDWNLNWNATLETGGVLVADEIKISCDVQIMKSTQASQAAA